MMKDVFKQAMDERLIDIAKNIKKPVD